MATDASAVARFEREMRVTAAIEHPHTVRVYDFGQIEGQPFLAMEYLAGRSLRQELDRSGALPAERVASIGVQIAKALGAAHRVGVVHRDLKPDNVMLVEGYGERDFVKVLDFGIARSLDQGEAGFRTKAGAIIGTPAYMSPEQASTVPLDARSDLYSLGVVLYEMLAGTPPFVGESITALLFAHVSRQRRRDRRFVVAVRRGPDHRHARSAAPRRHRDVARCGVPVGAAPLVDGGLADGWWRNHGAIAVIRRRARRARDAPHRAVETGGGEPALAVAAHRRWPGAGGADRRGLRLPSRDACRGRRSRSHG
jgi:serine/threonine-protein kinase